MGRDRVPEALNKAEPQLPEPTLERKGREGRKQYYEKKMTVNRARA